MPCPPRWYSGSLPDSHPQRREEDFSLSEIAEDLMVSRNAVYDQLKRAVASLEEYESKLHLMEKHIERMALIQKIENQQIDNQQMQDYLEMLKKI